LKKCSRLQKKASLQNNQSNGDARQKEPFNLLLVIIIFCLKPLFFSVYYNHFVRKQGGESLKKIYKGTVEGDVIHLKENIDLPMGTHAIITLKTIGKEKQEDIKNRQLKLLDKGFNLGRKLYIKREDLYAR
jgi:hypothetical protein